VKRIAVLGCGLVGAAIARDLSGESDFDVTVADASEEALVRLEKQAAVRTRTADLGRPAEIATFVSEADAVVGALPGRLGFAMLEAVIAAGKPIADISFSPEDLLSLDALAREKGVTAVVDCGVSPGISNLAVGRAAAALDEVDEVTIFVGGLPADRHRPFGYAIVFSATDVIEEYTRPARVVENGRVVTREALSEVETIEVPGIGTLEAFLTDGLRTLLSTVRARSMKEKTLRYPGHADAMRALRDGGFFETRAVDVGGVSVSARGVTEKLLSRAWRLSEGEEEFTVLRVAASGRSGNGVRRRYAFELLDRTSRESGMTSMARTTGFPCAIAATMLARGQYRAPGVRPLEMLAADPAASGQLLEALRSRGLAWTERWEDSSPNPQSRIGNREST
jgi:saccharopine dehydrogenase-like NADP-dependent oxidoreductase